MTAEPGEYLVGAYLKQVEECDFVDYNVRVPGGGLVGLDELDVVGLRFSDSTAFLCEVTTHIRGLLYKNNRNSVDKIREKHRKQRRYARSRLREFENHIFEFWSPVVPVGYLTENLAKIRELTLVINGEYKRRVAILQERAQREKQPTENPAFRLLQILGSLRD